MHRYRQINTVSSALPAAALIRLCAICVKGLRMALVVALFSTASVVFAQSDESEAVDPQALIKELEERLAKEKEELENVKSQRESMQAEQEKIREELEAERDAIEEQEEKLFDLCEEHNTLNPDNPKDCEKELGA